MTDLRAQLAAVREGDYLSVEMDHNGHTSTLSGEVWVSTQGVLCIGYAGVYYADGDPHPHVTRVIEHRPRSLTVEELDALPPYSVVEDRDGELWTKDADGWWRNKVAKFVVQHAPLVLRSRGPEPTEGADQ